MVKYTPRKGIELVNDFHQEVGKIIKDVVTNNKRPLNNDEMINKILETKDYTKQDLASIVYTLHIQLLKERRERESNTSNDPTQDWMFR